MFFLLVVILLILCVYIRILKPHKHWKEKGIPYLKPWPVVGNIGSNVFRRRAFPLLLQDIYNNYPEKRYFGMYQFLKPTLLIKDPELIKTICIKEFDKFPEHRTFTPEDIDPFWAKNLFAMKGGEKWKDMRSIVSPVFTSSKLRMMFPLITDCAKQFSTYYLKKVDGTLTVDFEDSITRYANDLIASTAFGITCNSLEDKNNELFLIGREANNFGGIRNLKFILYTLSPMLMKALKVTLFSEETRQFFTNIVKQSIRIREEKGIVRPDLIHLLLEARKERSLEEESIKSTTTSDLSEKINKATKIRITDDNITAQAFGFFLGGFGTASSAMCFLCYELAVNCDVQSRLQDTIDETFSKCKSEVTYEALLEMKYLDMVVLETLRKWPTTLTDRNTVAPYTIEAENSEESSLVLDVGSQVWIPIYAIHRDPKYYPNPELFDPERFNDENKDDIKPYTYIPFGIGPKNCIGSRFALLEIKAFIFYLLIHFDIVPVKETPIPIVLNKGLFAAAPDVGFWLGLKSRYPVKHANVNVS